VSHRNGESEGQVLDFIIKLPNRSPDAIALLIVPRAIKHTEITTYAPGTITRTNIQCLVLGACDQLSLEDVVDLMNHWICEENLTLMRADRSHTVNFENYHSGLVLFDRSSRETISEALFSYHKSGRMVFAYCTPK
jgi:hypothetical protein